MNVSLVILLVVVGSVAIYVWWFFARSRSLLQQWATNHGYVILHSKSWNFGRNPAFPMRSKNQAVYFVRVRDAAARERSGWLCLGDFWIGLFSNDTEVKWDDE